ncbi:MAG: hypothetical protein MRY64_04425 [Hyphomonadaceae bacterium]|nr:hypothetical protein [Hyphomonadaceae bacterium]
MRKTLFGLATALAVLTAPAALADEFTSACEARTAEYFPDIVDAAAACSCITEKASPELLEEMKAAETPADLPEEAKDIMKACGYEV